MSSTVIDPKVVQALKEANLIEDVIAQYVNLKPSGKDLVGLCPFHDEKTPSFTVSPSSQLYHCFGCGEGGDAIAFIQKFMNVDFTEVVKQLGGDRVQTSFREKSPPTLKPATVPIPTGGELAKQPEAVWDCPHPEPVSDENWKVVSKDEKVPSDRSQVQQIIYKYSDNQEVRRF